MRKGTHKLKGGRQGYYRVQEWYWSTTRTPKKLTQNANWLLNLTPFIDYASAHVWVDITIQMIHQRRITREQKISCWTLLINVSKWSTEELEKPVYLAEYGKKIAQTILHIGFPSSIPPIFDPILQALQETVGSLYPNTPHQHRQ